MKINLKNYYIMKCGHIATAKLYTPEGKEYPICFFCKLKKAGDDFKIIKKKLKIQEICN